MALTGHKEVDDQRIATTLADTHACGVALSSGRAIGPHALVPEKRFTERRSRSGGERHHVESACA